MQQRAAVQQQLLLQQGNERLARPTVQRFSCEATGFCVLYSALRSACLFVDFRRCLLRKGFSSGGYSMPRVCLANVAFSKALLHVQVSLCSMRYKGSLHVFDGAAAGKKNKLLWYPEDNHSLDGPAADADFWANTGVWFLKHLQQVLLPPL